MTDEWPKTVRVGGREYDVHPQMPVSDFTELGQTLQNEVEKVTELCEAMGMDMPTDLDGGADDE